MRIAVAGGIIMNAGYKGEEPEFVEREREKERIYFFSFLAFSIIFIVHLTPPLPWLTLILRKNTVTEYDIHPPPHPRIRLGRNFFMQRLSLSIYLPEAKVLPCGRVVPYSSLYFVDPSFIFYIIKPCLLSTTYIT